MKMNILDAIRVFAEDFYTSTAENRGQQPLINSRIP